jgi:hypothetical protein
VSVTALVAVVADTVDAAIPLSLPLARGGMGTATATAAENLVRSCAHSIVAAVIARQLRWRLRVARGARHGPARMLAAPARLCKSI